MLPDTDHFPSSIDEKFEKKDFWSDMCLVAPESAKKAKTLRGSNEVEDVIPHS